PVHALLGATSAIEHVDGWTCFIKRSIRGNHRQWNFKVHRWGIGIKTLDALEPVLCTVSGFMGVHAVHPGFLKRNFLAPIPVTFRVSFSILFADGTLGLGPFYIESSRSFALRRFLLIDTLTFDSIVR